MSSIPYHPVSIPSTARKEFNYALEALRGLAAFFVLLGHSTIAGPTPDPKFHLSGIWRYQAPGHVSVIIFFMLSGFVIGLTNPQPITTNAERKLYLKKRLVRLYPLYFLTIVTTAAVAAMCHNPYSVGTIAGYAVFLQGLVVKVPAYNPPIWSIGYEIGYYLLFLLVSARRWRADWVAIFFLALGLLLSSLSIQPIVLVSYAYGAVFWFVGLFLARLPEREAPRQYGTMVAFLLLMLSYKRMDLLFSALNALRLDITELQAPSFYDRAITFSDFSLLVLCVPLLLCFTNRRLAGQRWLELASFATPAAYLVAYIISGKIKQPALFETVLLPSIFYVLATIFYLTSSQLNYIGQIILQKLVPLGLISYGIYIVHYPLYFLFQGISSFSGTATTFLIRLLLYFAVVFLLGWLMERKVQLWIRQRLM